eukprot:1157540-Pelagomonas_calceolata.AAC.22
MDALDAIALSMLGLLTNKAGLLHGGNTSRCSLGSRPQGWSQQGQPGCGGDISKAGLSATRSSAPREPSPGKTRASPRGSPQRTSVALDEEGALRMIQVGFRSGMGTETRIGCLTRNGALDEE